MSDNQQFCLRWNNHQSTLVQVIDSLLSSGVLVDCTLAAEGQFLHAHKVVLCACSPYLETLLSQHYEKHPIVILKDVKFQELKSMMDYMYKGEVNISQDQLGQFLKAAESLQIKGLTDGGGENDSRDVGSTSQKRHEPTPVRKAVPHQSRSPLVLPSHNTGLTIEPSKRSLPSHLSESQPDSPIRSREGSSSPTSRKRRRQRRPSQGDEDGHQDNSCDLPMQAQTMSITTVPTSIPPLPSGSSSTITKAPPPDEDSENPDSDRLSGLPAEGYIKEKIEPQPEMLIEPKTEYMEETNNDDSVEDLTLDDDDDYENMMESGPGPSHSGNNPNDSYATWQMTGDRQDEAYLNPADTGHRDSQGKSISTPIQLTPKICKSRQRSSGGTRSVSPPANNAIIDLCKSPTMSIRITDVSSHSNALTPTATSNASKDDGCDGIIDLLGDEEDYTIDLLDDLVINEDDDDNELNGDNHSDTTDAMDESTESDDDVILTAETSECCAPLSKPQSSPQSLRSPPHKIISPSKTCECRSPGSNGNRESPAAPLTEKAATARISASSASITDPTPPAKNLMVPEAARQIPNTEIDEETLKRFQLKNFSIRLSKNQCLEAIQNQEKLNFLYYFKVVERNTLKSKGRPAGTVKPIIIRRQVLKNTHKLPVSNRRGSCMIKKHQKKIHQKNKQQQRSVVMVRKVLKHLPKSPAGSDVIKSSLSSSKP